ncbi:TetR/AcrR family transcriptional regulator [Paenibacillus sp. JDR-2]|uniref:TetR/AcrR family transcriptional regulator n=1 Tax=Paenibacillus sp. (strain JDR-2) TaxID=324057 RepID=UPI000166B1DF|nr:TetR/AcrR family transcriptional regulator [Paenibacillus sp. JDR-2]ACS99000.1 transcriptional regulator, TetR family [Paenibacillus sp. JDR-2]
MGRRKKQPLDEATRAMIIKTAHDLFMEHGYRSVTTRQIAEACELTQPAMYHYFADKEALYTEVLRTVTEETKTAMHDIVDSPGTVRERLIQVVAYILLNMPDDLSQMERDIRHELRPENRQLITQWWRDCYLLPIAALFQEGQQTGQFRGIMEGGLDPYPSAFTLLSMIQRKPGGPGGPVSTVPIEMLATRTIDVLLYGLASELGREESKIEQKGDEKE